MPESISPKLNQEAAENITSPHLCHGCIPAQSDHVIIWVRCFCSHLSAPLIKRCFSFCAILPPCLISPMRSMTPLSRVNFLQMSFGDGLCFINVRKGFTALLVTMLLSNEVWKKTKKKKLKLKFNFLADSTVTIISMVTTVCYFSFSDGLWKFLDLEYEFITKHFFQDKNDSFFSCFFLM